MLERHRLLGRPFVLYPAITYAHKNHETLVAAFARLAADHPDAKLVLTGGEGSYEPVVRAAIHAYGLADRVERTGRIPEADLDVLYRRATVMAFPSRYEGFGLPGARGHGPRLPGGGQRRRGPARRGRRRRACWSTRSTPTPGPTPSPICSTSPNGVPCSPASVSSGPASSAGPTPPRPSPPSTGRRPGAPSTEPSEEIG